MGKKIWSFEQTKAYFQKGEVLSWIEKAKAEGILEEKEKL